MTRRLPSMSIVIATLALVAGACSSSGASASASGDAAGLASIELPGTSWKLVDLDGTDPANTSALLTLEFRADGNAGGSAGCNTYSGTYTVDGAKITFGPLLSTKMACEQPLMTMETTYLTALQATSSFGVDGSGNLVLAGTSTMTFAPA